MFFIGNVQHRRADGGAKSQSAARAKASRRSASTM
jgi:hypothetical protein